MVPESPLYEMEPRPEPVPRPKIVADGVMGMLIFVFAEIMMFAGLISAHTVVRSQVAGEMWPPYGQPRLPVQETAVNTAALLVSGIVLVFAYLAFKKEASRRGPDVDLAGTRFVLCRFARHGVGGAAR